MTASAPDLNRAKDLISRELPRYLGPRFQIHHIVADTFHHDDEDLVHIFVYLKPGHPELDPHLLIRFDDEMQTVSSNAASNFHLPSATATCRRPSLDHRGLTSIHTTSGTAGLAGSHQCSHRIPQSHGS